MDLELLLSECMELGLAADLDLVEISQKIIFFTPEQVLFLFLERLLQTKKLEVTEQRHNQEVVELQSKLEKSNQKIKELEAEVVTKDTEIVKLKSEMQNTGIYIPGSSVEVQETMEDDENYETTDWSKMPGVSGLYSICGNQFRACETAEKSTCTDTYINSEISTNCCAKSPSENDLANLSNPEQSDEMSPSPIFNKQEIDHSNTSPSLLQPESKVVDEDRKECAIQDNRVRIGRPRASNPLNTFDCPYCPQTLTMKQGLQKHLFIWHLEQRGVHKCLKCRTAYLTEHEAMRHQKRTHKIFAISSSFACRHCGKKFSSTIGRSNHERVHFRNNPK